MDRNLTLCDFLIKTQWYACMRKVINQQLLLVFQIFSRCGLKWDFSAFPTVEVTAKAVKVFTVELPLPHGAWIAAQKSYVPGFYSDVGG